MQPGRNPTFQPSVEGLEDRSLMAAHLTASLSNGLLRIDGTSGRDHIVVRQSSNRISVDGTTIKVSGQGRANSVKASSVDRIHIRGHEGNDHIEVAGNSLKDPVTVWAGTGNDKVWGGEGNDKIYGDAGNDVIYGRGGKDLIDGGAGYDSIDGGRGDDRLRGGLGNDTLMGRSGRDRLEGSDGNDALHGGADNDTLDGGKGKNYLGGDSGNDVIYSRSRRDTVDGGSGRDVAYFTAASAPQSYGSTLAEGIKSVEDFNHPASARVASLSLAAPFGAEVQQLIDSTNAYRASKGLSELSIDTRLGDAARYQAEYMAKTGHYAHDNLDGRDLVDRVRAEGYSYSFIGENIHLYDPAIRRTMGIDRYYQRSELARYYLDGWKVSPGHNANLLSKYAKNIGIAIAQAKDGRLYVAMVLGRP